jgi:hypothetical protein
LVGEKRKRLTNELIQAFIADLERLPAEIDTPAAGTVFHSTQDICRKHGLTAYDAAFSNWRCATGLHSQRRTRPWPGPPVPRASRFFKSAAPLLPLPLRPLR